MLFAVDALRAPPSSDARKAALERLATRPVLFQELRAEYPDTLPSEDNVQYWLAKKGFTGKGAGKAAKSYVAENPADYKPSDIDDDEEDDVQTQSHASQSKIVPTPAPPSAPRVGQQRAVFPLAEGEVSLAFPAEMSVASAKMMVSFVTLLLEQAEAQAKLREMIG